MKTIIKIDNLKDNSWTYIIWNDKYGDLLIGNKYSSAVGVKKGVKTVMHYINDPKKYISRPKYFILRAGNYREIARSPNMTAAEQDSAIAFLIAHGHEAEISYIKQ